MFETKVGFRALPYKTHHQRPFENNGVILARLLKNRCALIFEFLKQSLDFVKVSIVKGHTVAPGQIKRDGCCKETQR